MPIKIYLDMDGILADFMSAACKIHFNQYLKQTHPHLYTKAITPQSFQLHSFHVALQLQTERDIHSHFIDLPAPIPWNFFLPENNLGWNMNSDEFWAPILNQQKAFWSGIDGYMRTCRHAIDMLRVVYSIDPDFSILTTPSKNKTDECVKGKIEWAKSFLDPFVLCTKCKPLSSKIIPSFNKEEFARPDTVLVDDYEGNLDKWEAAGGLVVCYPRPWNSHCNYLPSFSPFVNETLYLCSNQSVHYAEFDMILEREAFLTAATELLSIHDTYQP